MKRFLLSQLASQAAMPARSGSSLPLSMLLIATLRSATALAASTATSSTSSSSRTALSARAQGKRACRGFQDGTDTAAEEHESAWTRARSCLAQLLAHFDQHPRPPFAPALALPASSGIALPSTPPSSSSSSSSWDPTSLLRELLDPILRAVPKKKVSHSRKAMRAANKGLKDRVDIVHCPGCGRAKPAHHLCTHCYSDIARRQKAEVRAHHERVEQAAELGRLVGDREREVLEKAGVGVGEGASSVAAAGSSPAPASGAGASA